MASVFGRRDMRAPDQVAHEVFGNEGSEDSSSSSSSSDESSSDDPATEDLGEVLGGATGKVGGFPE